MGFRVYGRPKKKIKGDIVKMENKEEIIHFFNQWIDFCTNQKAINKEYQKTLLETEKKLEGIFLKYDMKIDDEDYIWEVLTVRADEYLKLLAECPFISLNKTQGIPCSKGVKYEG